MLQRSGAATTAATRSWITSRPVWTARRVAGWLAEMFMKSNMGVLMNIVLGIIGAAVASFLFGLIGVGFGGWIGYLVAGVLGACILIGLVRAIRN